MKTLSGKFGVWAVVGATAVLSGCSHYATHVRTGCIFECAKWAQEDTSTAPVAVRHTESTGVIRATTVFTPQGGYQVIENGSTVTVTQISRAKR